jgi:hypothetical protein
MQLMQEHQVARHQDLVGVSASEINQMQQRLGIQFPTSYTLFLKSFGRSAGILSPWKAIYFDDLTEIREEFNERLAYLNPPFEVPSETLVIAQAEDIFDYLFCDGHEDPPVYRIMLLPESAFCEPCAPSFTAYLELLVLASSRDGWLDDLAGEETYAAGTRGHNDDQLI